MLHRVDTQPVFSFAEAGAPEWPRQVAALRWPCHYSAYDILGEPFHRSLTDLPARYADAARGSDVFGAREDRAAAMWLALGLANSTLAQSIRYAVEIAEGTRNGKQWIGSPAEMPLLTWLRSDGHAIPAFLDQRWQRQQAAAATARLRRLIKHAITVLQLEAPWLRQRPRQVTAAPLFDVDCAAAGQHRRSVTVNYPFIGLDVFAPERALRDDVRELATQWSRNILNRVNALEPVVAARIETLAHFVFSATLSTAWRDMRQVQRQMPRRRLGERLISGTPTHAGRVLGWWYRKHGLPVERYAHGGDRGTHIDSGWDLSELPFCSRYVTHGALERDNFTARAAAGVICRNFPEWPVFATNGSPKHQEIYRKTSNRPLTRSTQRRLLYVSGIYVSERASLSPIFKTPDHLYAEWQLWFIEALRRLGYDVTIKLHPDDVDGGAAALGHCGCKLVNGYLDPTDASYGCLIFDFPGSAWFDCLTGHTPMLLVDLGARQLDPRTADLVRRRCPIVTCTHDDANRLRVNPAEIDAAILVAQQDAGYDESSARKLFSP